MMKVETSALIGSALDWAVRESLDRNQLFEFGLTEDIVPSWRPSRNWSQGGPIIEQEKITVMWRSIVDEADESYWVAEHDAPLVQAYGPTPLIAAMRCFVASKLGDEVEVPDSVLRPETNP